MTRLEGRTSFQFLVFLLEVGVVLGGGWWWIGVNGGEFLECWYLVSYHALDCADPLCIHTNIWAKHESTKAKEPCKGSSDHRLLACVQGPVECVCVVRDTQNNWMRVIINFSRCKHDKEGTVIHDDGNIFETVDRNEWLVQIVLEMQERSLNYVPRESEMPPKF